MKFLLNQIVLSFVSVIILYFLSSSSEFLPYLDNGEFNWKNIVVLIIFVGVIAVSLTSSIIFVIFRYILKRDDSRKIVFQSLKISILLFLGFIVIFFLNFFHILNIYYGLGILLIFLILLLVI